MHQKMEERTILGGLNLNEDMLRPGKNGGAESFFLRLDAQFLLVLAILKYNLFFPRPVALPPLSSQIRRILL